MRVACTHQVPGVHLSRSRGSPYTSIPLACRHRRSRPRPLPLVEIATSMEQLAGRARPTMRSRRPRSPRSARAVLHRRLTRTRCHSRSAHGTDSSSVRTIACRNSRRCYSLAMRRRPQRDEAACGVLAASASRPARRREFSIATSFVAAHAQSAPHFSLDHVARLDGVAY